MIRRPVGDFLLEPFRCRLDGERIIAGQLKKRLPMSNLGNEMMRNVFARETKENEEKLREHWLGCTRMGPSWIEINANRGKFPAVPLMYSFRSTIRVLATVRLMIRVVRRLLKFCLYSPK